MRGLSKSYILFVQEDLNLQQFLDRSKEERIARYALFITFAIMHICLLCLPLCVKFLLVPTSPSILLGIFTSGGWTFVVVDISRCLIGRIPVAY